MPEMTRQPASMRLSTTAARDRLSEIITRVQDPRAYCVLTRHGRPVAAVVSMAELNRIWKQQDMEDIADDRRRPGFFTFGRGGHLTNAEAAEAIQEVQLTRRMEREVLKRAGLEPVLGGEIAVTETVAQTVPARRRRWWWRWWRGGGRWPGKAGGGAGGATGGDEGGPDPR